MKTRSINPECKIISEDDGTIDFIASDQTIDSYREIIMANGWRFDRFQKNAPFVNSHDYSDIKNLLGKCIQSSITDDQLICRVKYALDVPQCELAQFAFNMVAKGYLKAVSVGFDSEKETWPGQPDWGAACAAAKLDVSAAANVRGIFLQQQLIELSQCIIGANPSALVKAYRNRDASEEDLARLGFGDEPSFTFLSAAASAVDHPECTEVMRSSIAVEMQRFYNARVSPFARRNHNPDSPARERADAVESQQRADFLRQLQTMVQK